MTVAAPITSNTVTNLTWELIDTGATFGCTAATTGTTVVSSSAFTGGAGTFSLTKGVDASTAGTARNLCFKVTAGAGLTQAQSGSATWQFQAVSQ